MSQGFTDTIMLIRPASFDYNVQTARTNAFQVAVDAEHDELQQKVLKEFDAFASSLRAAGIKVEVFEDTVEPTKPDATFPNNWISFHEEGTVITYPMFAPNRRSEVRTDIV
ncbi:MAG: arginine deiminase-related protein [Saprospiraceae bacterium]|nr:arginine deiminase-related protein [Saprospiraceae bacterium]